MLMDGLTLRELACRELPSKILVGLLHFSMEAPLTFVPSPVAYYISFNLLSIVQGSGAETCGQAPPEPKNH